MVAIVWMFAPFISGFFNEPIVSRILQALSLIFIIDGVGIIPAHLLRCNLRFKQLIAESSGQKSVNESIVVRDGYKRVFDLTLIIITYILLFPLWLIVWVVVPLAICPKDRGPVFYEQERTGQQGKHFKVLKFRTMIPDAGSLTGQVWAAEDDPRLT